MSSRRKQKGKTGSGQQGLNFVVTLITLSIVCIFIGYLLGQYAVRMLKAQHTYKVQMAQNEESVAVAPVTAPPAVTPKSSQSVEETVSPPPVSPDRAPSNTLYRVQVGVFSERENADRMVARLEELGYDAIIIGGAPYRVQTGAFSSKENADRFSEELKSRGFDVIVVR